MYYITSINIPLQFYSGTQKNDIFFTLSARAVRDPGSKHPNADVFRVFHPVPRDAGIPTSSSFNFVLPLRFRRLNANCIWVRPAKVELQYSFLHVQKPCQVSGVFRPFTRLNQWYYHFVCMDLLLTDCTCLRVVLQSVSSLQIVYKLLHILHFLTITGNLLVDCNTWDCVGMLTYLDV